MMIVLPILAVLALLFVYWIGLASFEDNCYDIYRQSYGTILGQSISEIESAVRNGKTLESYFGIDKLLLGTAEYIRDNAQAAITDSSGRLMYATFEDDSEYAALFRTEQVRLYMGRTAPDRESVAVASGTYEILIQPIYAPDSSQSGNLCLVYPARDASLFAQQSEELLTMTLIVSAVIVVAIFVWLYISGRPGNAIHKWMTTAMPLIIITAGIVIQGVLSFFTYQSQYRQIMLDSAHTTCRYIESLVSQAHAKGVPYDRMYGLDEFFAEKLEELPGLWDIKLVQVLANSQDILARDTEFQLSMPISRGGEQMDLRLDVTLSQQFIDERMSETMLLSMITLIISIVAVVEITRLPELISLRFSHHEFGRPRQRQYAGIQSALRLGSFLMYTGVYIVMPFSSLLVSQWRQTLFGFSLEVTAGIPMTVEIFSLMVGGLACAAIFKRLNVRIGLGMAVALFVAANAACLFVADPMSLAVLRFLAGFGFSAILYTANYITSYGTEGSGGRSAALAGMNSGLLGGIMAGGALGAVIANTMGVAMCFIVAAALCVAVGVILLLLVPWKMLKEAFITTAAANAESKAERKKARSVGILLHPRMWIYFLLVMAPFSFGLMFIVAGMPAFVTASGLSPLMLSCGFLANGVAGIYLGEPLLKALTSKFSYGTLIMCVLVTGGIAIGAIFLPPAWLTLIICAFLLGVFDGVGTPTTMNAFIELPGISAMPSVDSLAVGNTLMRIVNTASPVLYGVLIAAATGSMTVFAILGGAFIAAGAVYFIISKTKMMRAT